MKLLHNVLPAERTSKRNSRRMRTLNRGQYKAGFKWELGLDYDGEEPEVEESWFGAADYAGCQGF